MSKNICVACVVRCVVGGKKLKATVGMTGLDALFGVSSLCSAGMAGSRMTVRTDFDEQRWL
jgi:hypothetical protein